MCRFCTFACISERAQKDLDRYSAFTEVLLITSAERISFLFCYVYVKTFSCGDSTSSNHLVARQNCLLHRLLSDQRFSALCVCCFVADCLCVCFSLLPLRPLCASSVSGPSCQCSAIVHLRAAHLRSCHSHGSGLCHSVPHQSDRSQLRQSSSVLLPLCRSQLPAGGQVRASTGPEDSEYVPETPGLGMIIRSHHTLWKHS